MISNYSVALRLARVFALILLLPGASRAFEPKFEGAQIKLTGFKPLKNQRVHIVATPAQALGAFRTARAFLLREIVVGGNTTWSVASWTNSEAVIAAVEAGQKPGPETDAAISSAAIDNADALQHFVQGAQLDKRPSPDPTPLLQFQWYRSKTINTEEQTLPEQYFLVVAAAGKPMPGCPIAHIDFYDKASEDAQLKLESAAWGDGVHARTLVVTFDAVLSPQTRSNAARSGLDWFHLEGGRIMGVRIHPTNDKQLEIDVDQPTSMRASLALSVTKEGEKAIVGLKEEKLEPGPALKVGRGSFTTNFNTKTAALGLAGGKAPDVNATYEYELKRLPLIRDGKDVGYESQHAIAMIDSAGNLTELGKITGAYEWTAERMAARELTFHRYGYAVRGEADGDLASANAQALLFVEPYLGYDLFLKRVFGGFERFRFEGVVGHGLDNNRPAGLRENDDFARINGDYHFQVVNHVPNKPGMINWQLDLIAQFNYLVDADRLFDYLQVEGQYGLLPGVALNLRYTTGEQAPNFIHQDLITGGLRFDLD